MIELPSEFCARVKRELGSEYSQFISSYNLPVARGVRVNTLKISVEDFMRISSVNLDGGVPWEKNGFYTDSESPGKTILHAAGLYYVQEPSAMCAAPELCVKAGERVLDLCSAPGGKGTQLAQSMNGDGVLVLNEILPKRAEILRSNVERLGVKNALVTSAEPSVLAGLFEEYFDKILVDAPCSGEGMFKKEQSAIPEWSLDNVLLCVERQKNILNSAAIMLSCGGRLVYSTCTFSLEEDEKQVENFLKSHKDFVLVSMKKLLPHKVRGEGHFCAVLEKTGGGRKDLPLLNFSVRDKKLLKVYREWERETLNISIDRVMQSGNNFYYIPDGSPDLAGSRFKYNEGIFLGQVSPDGKRFEPSHTLAMSLKNNEAACIPVDEKTARDYLRGITFGTSCSGWKVVTYLNYPLGWCKGVNGTAKNHLPKGLRI